MTLTVRDFRNNLATSLDKAMAGERVMVRRGKQLFTIVPVEEDDLTITPELEAKIEKARQEHRDGKTISLKNHEDIDKFFEK